MKNFSCDQGKKFTLNLSDGYLVKKSRCEIITPVSGTYAISWLVSMVFKLAMIQSLT